MSSGGWPRSGIDRRDPYQRRSFGDEATNRQIATGDGITEGGGAPRSATVRAVHGSKWWAGHRTAGAGRGRGSHSGREAGPSTGGAFVTRGHPARRPPRRPFGATDHHFGSMCHLANDLRAFYRSSLGPPLTVLAVVGIFRDTSQGWVGAAHGPAIRAVVQPLRKRRDAISRRRSPHVVLRSSSRRPPPSLGAWAHDPPVRAARRPATPLHGRVQGRPDRDPVYHRPFGRLGRPDRRDRHDHQPGRHGHQGGGRGRRLRLHQADPLRSRRRDATAGPGQGPGRPGPRPVVPVQPDRRAASVPDGRLDHRGPDDLRDPRRRSDERGPRGHHGRQVRAGQRARHVDRDRLPGHAGQPGRHVVLGHADLDLDVGRDLLGRHVQRHRADQE